MNNEVIRRILINELIENENMLFVVAEVAAELMGLVEDAGEYVDGEAWHRVDVNLDDYLTMGDPSFKLHFRMNRTTFEILEGVVREHRNMNYMLEDDEDEDQDEERNEGRRRRLRRERTPLRIVLMMVLWILATPDSFRSVALRFGSRPGTVHFHYLNMIDAFRRLAPTYIKWPNERERAETKDYYEARTGFPGVVGCIDGTHIEITSPRVNGARYINRHHKYSINLQLVCDQNLLITDMYVGECGSVHDARVFQRSPLCQQLLQNNNVIGFDEHILGDGGYTLLDCVLTPFRNNGRLTALQRNYNRMHARTRSPIENCNGLLKMKWRRLLHLNALHMEIVVDHITACGMLHNFVILQGEVPEDPDDYEEPDESEIDEEEDDDDDDDGNDNDDNIIEDAIVEPNLDLMNEAKERGAEKRIHVMLNLPRLYA